MKSDDIMRKKNSYLSVLMEILISISLTAVSLSWIFNVPHRKILVASLVSIVGILFFILHGKKLDKAIIFLGLYIALLDIWAYRILDHQYSLSLFFFWIMLSLAISILLIKRELSYFTILIPFIITTGLFILGVVLKIEDVSDGNFYYLNRNNIAKIVLSYGILSNLVWMRLKASKPLIWTSILILFGTYFSRSRIGLFTAILYFVLTLSIYVISFIKKSNKVKFKDKKNILIIIISSIASILIIYWMIKNSRLKTEGVASQARMELIRSFFSELTLKKFILGFKSQYMVENGLAHMHNSFLQLVMSTGAISIPLLVIYCWGGIKLLRNSLFLFGIFLILGVYSLVEHFIFFGIGDFVLIPLLFLSHALSKERRQDHLMRTDVIQKETSLDE